MSASQQRDLREFLDNLPKEPCRVRPSFILCTVCFRINQKVAERCPVYINYTEGIIPTREKEEVRVGTYIEEPAEEEEEVPEDVIIEFDRPSASFDEVLDVEVVVEEEEEPAPKKKVKAKKKAVAPKKKVKKAVKPVKKAVAEEKKVKKAVKPVKKAVPEEKKEKEPVKKKVAEPVKKAAPEKKAVTEVKPKEEAPEKKVPEAPAEEPPKEGEVELAKTATREEDVPPLLRSLGKLDTKKK